jgi:hypothetical protein
VSIAISVGKLRYVRADVDLYVWLQETEKIALAESTGLDQKQINNWFINQRKRHWKPAPEDMPYSMMDGTVGFHAGASAGASAVAALYMERAPFMVDGMYRLGS